MKTALIGIMNFYQCLYSFFIYFICS